MRRLVMIALSLSIIITVTGCNPSGSTSTSESSIMQESPKTYVLTSDAAMMTGAVYRYRPKADYLSVYSKIDGEELTLDMVQLVNGEIAGFGNDIPIKLSLTLVVEQNLLL